MAITNTWLTEAAKAFGNVSFTIPAYLAVGTSTIGEDIQATSIAGEVGTRKALTIEVTNNTVTYTGYRLSTDVFNTISGDNIKLLGTLSAITGGNLFQNNSVSGLLQTTTYDVEVVLDTIFDRL